MYGSIIEPNLRYCCTVWGCCTKTDLIRLQSLQNGAARIVTNSGYDAHSLPLIKGLGWAGLGWAGLGWAGLGWAGLGCAGQGCAGQGCAGLGWAG